MKIGREPAADLARVKAARAAIGDAPELFVDANGACLRKQALAFAEAFSGFGVTWFEEPVSSHCAPALHLHACCALPSVWHMEYFYDHQRIERMLFDGAQEPAAGELRPALSRPGLGLALKRADAERYAV